MNDELNGNFGSGFAGGGTFGGGDGNASPSDDGRYTGYYRTGYASGQPATNYDDYTASGSGYASGQPATNYDDYTASGSDYASGQPATNYGDYTASGSGYASGQPATNYGDYTASGSDYASGQPATNYGDYTASGSGYASGQPATNYGDYTASGSGYANGQPAADYGNYTASGSSYASGQPAANYGDYTASGNVYASGQPAANYGSVGQTMDNGSVSPSQEADYDPNAPLYHPEDDAYDPNGALYYSNYTPPVSIHKAEKPNKKAQVIVAIAILLVAGIIGGFLSWKFIFEKQSIKDYLASDSGQREVASVKSKFLAQDPNAMDLAVKVENDDTLVYEYKYNMAGITSKDKQVLDTVMKSLEPSLKTEIRQIIARHRLEPFKVVFRYTNRAGRTMAEYQIEI